jgi:hypothetical protein
MRAHHHVPKAVKLRLEGRFATSFEQIYSFLRSLSTRILCGTCCWFLSMVESIHLLEMVCVHSRNIAVC